MHWKIAFKKYVETLQTYEPTTIYKTLSTYYRKKIKSRSGKVLFDSSQKTFLKRYLRNNPTIDVHIQPISSNRKPNKKPFN
jgi:dolichyl-phosphate-mannose--protein O-mannosyl transferase